MNLGNEKSIFKPVESVTPFTSVGALPSPYTGVARVGTDLYVGDGSAAVAVGGGAGTVVNLASGNTASQNTAAIQAALDLAGDVYVVGSGVRLINATLIIKSNTKLILSSDLILRLATSANCNMLRNTAWSGTAKTVTAVSVTNPTIAGSPAVLATASIIAHGKNVGDFVYIHGVTPDIYNGIWEVYSKTTDTLSYIMAYDVGDAIASGAGTKHAYIPPSAASDIYAINASNAISATSGVTTVTSSAGFPTGTAWVGKTLQVRTAGVNGVVTELGVIATVTTSSSLELVAGSTATYSGKFNILNPAGMFMRDADVNISITGGEWDYNGYNQPVSSTYLNHAIYLRRVGFLSISDAKMSNVTKYAFALGNIYHGSVTNINLDTNSDGVHWVGSGDYIITDGIYGRAGDDFTVAGHSDYWFHMDQDLVMGDFGSIVVKNIKPRMALSGFKWYGCGQYTGRDITLDNIGGIISGGQGVALIGVDKNCVGSEGDWCTATNVSISGQWDQGYSKGCIVLGGVLIKNLTIPYLTCGLGNTAGTSNGLFLAGGTVIDSISTGALRFYAASGAYSVNATGIYTDGTVLIRRATIASLSGEKILTAIRIGTTGNAEDTCILNIGALQGEYLDYAVNSAGRVNVNVGVATRRGITNSDKFFAFADYSKLTVGRGFGLTGSTVIVATGKNLTINAPDVGVDLSTIAGTLVGTANSSFFNSSTGVVGTLEVNNTVMYRPAISKWVQCTDTTKTSG